MDSRAVKRWQKSQISYENYLEYVTKKTCKFKLTFIDLLYVSNFKGGNATINESESKVNEKLDKYTEILNLIHSKFGNKNLENCTCLEIYNLLHFSQKLFEFVDKDETRIDGFGISFLTALIHFHFPNLYPILDRRVLNGFGLLTSEDKNNQGQVKNIKKFYPILICKMKLELENRKYKITLREIDKEMFIKPFNVK